MRLRGDINAFIRRNKAGLVILTVFFLTDIVYLLNTTANVPIMDYWRYGDEFLDEIYNGGIKFSTFWESINGQRAVLTYFLFLINVKIFHWNTRVAVFFGAFVTGLTGLLLLKIMDADPDSEVRRPDLWLKNLTILGIIMVLFNYVQWEIKTIEFSAPFSVITFFIVLNMWLADRILNNLEMENEKVLWFAVLLGVCICFIYSAFFPAVVGAICICRAIQFFSDYKKDKFRYIGKYLITGSGIAGAAFIYLRGITGVVSSDANLTVFGQNIVNGEFARGLAIYLGSSILHTSFAEKLGFPIIIVTGSVVGILYILAICYCMKYRARMKSFFPLMLMLYTLLSALLLLYGRGNVFGPEYLCSSRYACQSRIGLTGILLVFREMMGEGKKVTRLSFLAKVLVPCFIISGMILSQMTEFRLSPFRRLTYDTMIEYIYDIDNKEDEDLSVFQANTPSQVRNTIESMKKYRLGIFYYLPADGRYDQLYGETE